MDYKFVSNLFMDCGENCYHYLSLYLMSYFAAGLSYDRFEELYIDYCYGGGELYKHE
jgi:hypothetical protein